MNGPGGTRALPAGWPAGRLLAVSVNVMLEQWADDAAPGIGPMGNPLRAGVLDLQARSWAAYGPKTGIWRLLDILAAHDVTAVVYASGLLAERYPAVIAAVAQAGHVIAAHGWTQDVIPPYQAAAAEADDLRRSVDALRCAAGVRPRGYISPRCTPSSSTAATVRAAGLDWHADYFDEDLPRPIALPHGALMAIPFTMEINDLPHSVRYGNEPSAFAGTLVNVLACYPGPLARPACLDITVHAHVYGRPPGAVAFAQALQAVRDHRDAAFLTNHQHLADMFAAAPATTERRASDREPA